MYITAAEVAMSQTEILVVGLRAVVYLRTVFRSAPRRHGNRSRLRSALRTCDSVAPKL